MNNESAKEILSAYRPDGSDAQNEIFKQALEQCQRDPELRAWFTDQIQIDASMVRGLRDIHIHSPEEAKQAMPLDHRSDDRAELVHWLEQRNAPVPPELPDIFDAATAAGCRIFEDGRSGRVSLFCFQMDGGMCPCFTFDEQTRPYLKHPKDEWWCEGDWNMIAFEKEVNLFTIATQLWADRFSKYL